MKFSISLSLICLYIRNLESVTDFYCITYCTDETLAYTSSCLIFQHDLAIEISTRLLGVVIILYDSF